jgi:two-component system, OmpR family, response regulator
MSKKLIYIADDDEKIRSIIKSFLISESFEVETFQDGESILAAFLQRPCDMLIIDILMPGMDGYSLCAAIREKSSVPIIIISAKDSELDKITGLTLGSDDYMTKPFSPLELIARIKSTFRRIELDQSDKHPSSSVAICDLTLTPETKQAFYKGVPLHLTLMEFDLFLYLVRNRNKAVSREELLNKIWGFETDVETRATDDMIKRVRKKIAAVGSSLRIETVWGFGFKIIEKEKGSQDEGQND